MAGKRLTPMASAYDLTEATQLLDLGRAVFKVDVERQRPAVNQLIDEVAGLAKSRGWDVDKKPMREEDDSGGTFIYCNKVGVRLFEDGCLPVVESQRIRGVALPVEFDPEAGRFVGTEWDEFYVGVPGEPRKRKSAVAAICYRIVFEVARQRANIARSNR